MQTSAYTKPLNLGLYRSDLLYILTQVLETLWSNKICQKIADRRVLCQVRVKSLLAQIIPNKIFGTNWSNPVKLDRQRKILYLFLRVF